MTETDVQLWDACLETGLCDESALERAKACRAVAVGRGAPMDLLAALAAEEVLSTAQVGILRRAISDGGKPAPGVRPTAASPSSGSAGRQRSFPRDLEPDPAVEGLAVLDEAPRAREEQREASKKLAPLPLDASLPAPDAVARTSLSSILVGALALITIAAAAVGAIYILPKLVVPDATEVIDDPPPDTDPGDLAASHPAMVALGAALEFAQQHPDRIVETRERLDALEAAHAEVLGAALEDARVRAEDAHRSHRAARFERLQAKAARLRDAGDPVGAALTLLEFPEDLRAGDDGEKWTEAFSVALQHVRKATGMALCPGGAAPPVSDSSGEHVPAFLIDLTEVSNSAYAEFVAVTGARAPAHWRNNRPTTMLTSRPVVGITVAEAKAYAKWAGKRLPSMVEWQLAAAGPEGWRYPWGETYDPSRCRAALGDKATPSGLAPTRTHSDGRALCGAYHLVGNAAEWVAEVTTSSEGHVLHLALGGSALAEQPHTRQRDAYPGDTNDPALLIGFRCVKDAR